MAQKPRKKTRTSRVTAVERGVGFLRASDTTILNEVRLGFARVENRLEQIYNHIDGFIKLHETLDIEFKVIKEQMKRLEERVDQLEAAGKH